MLARRNELKASLDAFRKAFPFTNHNFMGRSVSYLNHAQEKTFFPFEWDQDNSDFAWQNMKDDPVYSLHKAFPSLIEPSKERWDDNEAIILLENTLVEIGLSEYCGLVSLSIRPKEFDSWHSAPYLTGFAVNWIKQNWPKLKAAITYEVYYKQGSMSNGEGVYKKELITNL